MKSVGELHRQLGRQIYQQIRRPYESAKAKKRLRRAEDEADRAWREVRQFKRLRVRRILMIGPPGSGKSTLLTDWRLQRHYQASRNQLSSEDRGECKSLHLHQFNLTTQAIIKQMLECDISTDYESPDLQKLLRELHDCSESDLGTASGKVLRYIWGNPKFLAAYSILQKACPRASLPKYISDNLHRILSADYVPTDADMMKIYVPTHGSHETQVEIRNDTQWVITEPGNHVATQPKLWHFFDDVPIVVFTVPLSEYDAKPSGDGKTQNFSFMDLVPQFRAVCEAPEFSTALIMLLLTKIDLFREKIATDPLENHFPEYLQSDYPFTHDNWAEITFIRDLFKHGNSRERVAYHHVLSDRDVMSPMGLVLRSIEDELFMDNRFLRRWLP